MKVLMRFLFNLLPAKLTPSAQDSGLAAGQQTPRGIAERRGDTEQEAQETGEGHLENGNPVEVIVECLFWLSLLAFFNTYSSMYLTFCHLVPPEKIGLLLYNKYAY